MSDDIDPTIPPSGTGCVECLSDRDPGWWLHLWRCASCGHVACCDNSPRQHSTAHFRSTGHPIMASFEPGEDWFWDFSAETYASGAELAAPTSHPADQPAPGPAGAVPRDWQEHLN